MQRLSSSRGRGGARCAPVAAVQETRERPAPGQHGARARVRGRPGLQPLAQRHVRAVSSVFIPRGGANLSSAELRNSRTHRRACVRACAFGRHRIIAEARSSARGIRWGLSEATAKRTNPNTPASSAALTAFQQAAVATGANHGRLSTSYPSLRGRSRRTDRRRKHTHTGNETSQTQFRRR